ncbi:MAG: DUF3560 domain-containing protein [Colwellia sp.]|jgi:Domain of unknown function (DUF3560).
MFSAIDISLFDATYSAEDNKLRIYSVNRLDEDLYREVKAAGFHWAPKQELFVAPSWTPQREDLCLKLAGEITAEQTTLVERAEAKAGRLDALADKRAGQSNNFREAAGRISERFTYGQPILVGHHSERKARKDKAQMVRAMEQAHEAAQAVDYWNYRAEGVERHVNHKTDPGVRSRRISTLLKELRDRQRNINHGYVCLKLWEGINALKGTEAFYKKAAMWCGAHIKSGPVCPSSFYTALNDGTMMIHDVVEKSIIAANNTLNSRYTGRWICHILNRLAFEQSELGGVNRFEGEITSTILKGFVREHGAHKPDSKKSDGNWLVTSSVPLPIHIADGKGLTLTDEEWRDLMQATGYKVPAPTPKKAPILNFKAETINGIGYNRKITEYSQVSMTKSEYSKVYSDYRGVKYSECGKFRFRICKDPKHVGGGYGHGWDYVAVFFTDSKEHPVPDSQSNCSAAA